jgi:hypothetical protein
MGVALSRAEISEGSVGDDVALVIETDSDRQAVLIRVAILDGCGAPNALVVLLQSRDVAVALGFDVRFGLGLGEAVCADDGRPRIVAFRRLDGRIGGFQSEINVRQRRLPGSGVRGDVAG